MRVLDLPDPYTMISVADLARLTAERDDAVRLLAKLRDWDFERGEDCSFCRAYNCAPFCTPPIQPCADRLRAEELCKGVKP